MGLSASQARLLTLTARQHAIEYKAQKLEAEKLQLANDSDQVYNTYLNALDAKKIQYKHVDNDGSITFIDANFASLREEKMLFKVGSTICNSYDQVRDAMQSEYGISLTASGDSYTMLTSLVSEGYVVLIQPTDEMPDGYSYEKSGSNWIFKAPNPVYDPNATSGNASIEQLSFTFNTASTGSITSATAFTNITSENVMDYFYNFFKDTSVSTSTKVQEVSDEVGLKKAEAQYEADMNQINRKDTQYDTQLSQLETERKAIKEEIDTLKSVAKDNVDRTFKLFS